MSKTEANLVELMGSADAMSVWDDGTKIDAAIFALQVTEIYLADMHKMLCCSGGGRQVVIDNCKLSTKELMSALHKISICLENPLDYKKTPVGKLPSVTKRELEVLQMISSGAPLIDVAISMGISKASVNLYIARVCRKFNATSKDDVISILRGKGIL